MGVRNEPDGFGLVEVIIGAAALALLIVVVMNALSSSLVLSQDSLRRTQAAYLLEEGVEAVRVMRDSSWNSSLGSLTASTTYYFMFFNNTWQATSTNIMIDNLFERKFVLSNVYRDSNKDIAPAGTLDNNTKLVTVSIAWRDERGTTTQTMAAYLTNLFGN